MTRGLVLRAALTMALLAPDACLAQQKPDEQAERIFAERIQKLEERFSREAAGRKDDVPLRETDIEALLLILNREKTKGVRTTRYIQVLEALGRFPDNHSAVRAL